MYLWNKVFGSLQNCESRTNFQIISFKKRAKKPSTFAFLVNEVLCLRAFRLDTKSYQNILKRKKWL